MMRYAGSLASGMARSRRGLAVEWAFWFVGFPFIAFLEWFPVSKFLFFALPLLYALLVMTLCKGVDGFGSIESQESGPRIRKRWVLLRMVAIVTLLALFASLRHPEDFLVLPQERFGLWVMILLLYPLLSAFPQEFLYRRFYFRRYAFLFGNPAGVFWSNVAVFSWLHLMYDNLTAMVLTFLGGWLFARTYLQTARLWLPWIEHTLYGLAIFTFGLGRYFYEPVGG